MEHFILSQLWYPKRTVKHNKTDTVKVSFVVEKMPEFPGGMVALMRYIGKHIKYPEKTRKKIVPEEYSSTLLLKLTVPSPIPGL